MSDNQGTYRRRGFDLIIYKIKQRSYELDEKNPVKLWLSFYIGLFFFAILLGVIFGLYIPFKTIDVNSARYVLSALIQSQAAVISIVITLTLIAVQVTAQTYSPRVTEVFKKHPNMWCFLTSYIISIAFSSIVLTYLVGTDLADSVATRISLYISCLLGIFLFFALILYIYNTLNLLNAETILKRLTDAIQIPDEVGPEDDPFQPVFDVIYGAIRRFDLPTMSYGFKQVKNKYQDILLRNQTHTYKIYIISRFFDDFKRCGFLLIERREERYAFEVANELASIGKWSVKKRSFSSLSSANRALVDIGVQAANNRLRSPLDHVIASIDEISQYIEILNDDLEGYNPTSYICQLIKDQRELGIAAVLNDQEYSAKQAVNSILKMYKRIICNDTSDSIECVINSFSLIGSRALEKKSSQVIDEVVNSLEMMYRMAINNQNTLLAENSLKLLGSFGLSAERYGLKNQIWNILGSIFRMTVKAHDNKANELYRLGVEQLAKMNLKCIQIFDDYLKLDYGDTQPGIIESYATEVLQGECDHVHRAITQWIDSRDEFRRPVV